MSAASEDETEVGVLIAAKEAVLQPIRYATSKPAQRAYISTVLFGFTSLFLLGTAITAYVLFYYTYIPARGFSRPIHLQFGPDHPPYGLVTLSQELVSDQRYDVRIILDMPRTPSNTAAGNFMLDLRLLAPGTPGSSWSSAKGELLAQETRPAILTYHSVTMDHVHKVAALPLHLLGLREESEVLDVKMMDGIVFARGWRNVPAMARLELRSENKLQVYRASIAFTARFAGLRHVMYNFRITSFLVLTGAFWIVEMAFVAVTWVILSMRLFPQDQTTSKTEDEGKKIKQETGGHEGSDAMSDTPRTFPTLSGQAPLHYSSPYIKSEEEDVKPAVELHPVTAEADDEDDEDEDADFVLDEPTSMGRGVYDSGIGSSMDSSAGKSDAVRRRSLRPAGMR